ncbi:MAG: FapA family protein [Spirochaetes bacterium]|nr:FapA family protein [Spirochaetota bacterium]
MIVLKEILRKLIEEESGIEQIVVKASSLEEALKKASDQLGVEVGKIDYEIVEFGNKGMFGIGKKDFKIKAYVTKDRDEVFSNIMNIDYQAIAPDVQDIEIEEKIIDQDSEVFVKVTSKGVMLKVTPKIGKGRKINEKKVYSAIQARGVSEFNDRLINKIINETRGEYIKIGEMPVNVAHDSTATIQVSSDEMKAFIIITPPKPGGFDIDIDEIKNILHNNGVVVGIKEDTLKKIIDYPTYNEPILIAEGKKAENGKDAVIHYNFNVNREEIHLMEEDGRVNFKELNIVQNVVAGQILATKELPTEGEPGRTVTNKLLPAKSGKDTNLFPGRNTKLTEDGLNIVAEINGQTYLIGSKVVVDPVYTIQGDVNLKTGNILFLGTVVVQGSIEDGFNVKAAGNIEIHGSVGKSELDAEGDVIINGGIMGKNDGRITSGKNVYAKFIESVRVDAGEGVYVQDGILHSEINATKEILCVGKRGAIVGGKLRAGELVKTKTLGSVASPETIIEVGVDPKKRQLHQEFIEKRDKAYKEVEPLKANIDNLTMQKKTMRTLSPEKEELLKNLNERYKELTATIKECDEEIRAIDDYLAELKSRGKVIASKIAFPGVKIYIKNSNLILKNEYKKVAFILQAGEINTQLYREEEERK